MHIDTKRIHRSRHDLYETTSNTSWSIPLPSYHRNSHGHRSHKWTGMAGVALCRGFPIPADAAQGICDGIGAVRGVLVERSFCCRYRDLPNGPEFLKKFLHKLFMKGRKESVPFGVWQRCEVARVSGERTIEEKEEHNRKATWKHSYRMLSLCDLQQLGGKTMRRYDILNLTEMSNYGTKILHFEGGYHHIFPEKFFSCQGFCFFLPLFIVVLVTRWSNWTSRWMSRKVFMPSYKLRSSDRSDQLTSYSQIENWRHLLAHLRSALFP